jgi:hypothetical protein
LFAAYPARIHIRAQTIFARTIGLQVIARVLLIAYSTYVCDARVKRHAEALVQRGDSVDVICLAPDQPVQANGVNLIAIAMPRYRGLRRSSYLRSYLRFFLRASVAAARMTVWQRYDLVIVCTMPDAAIVCALAPRLLGTKVILDVHDTMPELYLDTSVAAGVGWVRRC